MTKYSMEFYENLERLLSVALEQLKGQLSEQAYRYVEELIYYGEYGVGWDHLWHIVCAEQLTAPPELIESGRQMGFDTSAPSL